jgi:serine/threonine protein kinase
VSQSPCAQPSNILLDADGTVKIVDFGLSVCVSSGQDLTAETGTYRFMAPEVICHKSYGTSADVYSFGVVLWQLLTREQPFQSMTPVQAAFAVARQGVRPAVPPGTPPRLAGLIQRCWHHEASQRPTFHEVATLLPQVRTLV